MSIQSSTTLLSKDALEYPGYCTMERLDSLCWRRDRVCHHFQEHCEPAQGERGGAEPIKRWDWSQREAEAGTAADTHSICSQRQADSIEDPVSR